MGDGMATSSSTSDLVMPFLTSQNPMSVDMNFVDILRTNSQFAPKPSIVSHRVRSSYDVGLTNGNKGPRKLYRRQASTTVLNQFAVIDALSSTTLDEDSIRDIGNLTE